MTGARLAARAGVLAALLVAGAAPAQPADRQAALGGELVRTLDALVALERSGGGWTFRHPPGERPEPCTAPLRLAERVAAPLGLARWDVVVLRSPGTPAAGLALARGYRLTGRAEYLAAARRAGDLLIAVQLPSGGWFSEVPVEGTVPSPWFAWTFRRTALDDDVTTGAIRLVLELWEATGERRYRAAAERGLALLVRAQRRDGAWPLVWRPPWKRALWKTFEDLATLNDATSSAAIETLLAAGRELGRADFVAAARRGGDWLLRARRAPPQAGWAQQYDAGGAPAAARRFEPAALASWETRYAIDTLLALAAATGDARYCEPIADAARWLAASAIGPGCWARFYALGTNAPLYVGADGAPVATVEAARPGYDWTGDFGVSALLARLGVDGAARGAAPMVQEAIHARPIVGDAGVCPGERARNLHRHAPGDPRPLIAHAAALLAALEPPGASPCVAPPQARKTKNAGATTAPPRRLAEEGSALIEARRVPPDARDRRDLPSPSSSSAQDTGLSRR